MNKEFKIKNEDSYSEVFKELQKSKEKVFFLNGSLGAGKTTFVSKFLKNLVGQKNFNDLGVMSPTFSIVNEYETNGLKVIHADFYRLDNKNYDIEDFLEELPFADYSFIEWGSKLPEIKSSLESFIEIHIEKTELEKERLVKLSS